MVDLGSAVLSLAIFGSTTVTDAVSVSVAVLPSSSSPVAVAVLIVSPVRVVAHVNVHDSSGSRASSVFVSPSSKVTGEHLSSLTATFTSDSGPGVVTTYVYVTCWPVRTTDADADLSTSIVGTTSVIRTVAESVSVAVSPSSSSPSAVTVSSWDDSGAPVTEPLTEHVSVSPGASVGSPEGQVTGP